MRQNAEVGVWDRLVRERVGEPLRPGRLRSLLVVVPAASGDVALATTVIRHVKRLNPDCRVTFATEEANLGLIRLCPGVEETIAVPHVPREMLSGRRSLREFAGRAEAVIYPNWWPENRDLLAVHDYNMLESIWLLAGVADGVPAEPQRVWLEPPPSAEASAVIRRALGRQAVSGQVVRAALRLPESLAAIARTRSAKGSRITLVGRDSVRLVINAVELSLPAHRRRMNGAALDQDFVILCTEARSIPPPPRGVTKALVGMLRRSGRSVLHNVRDPVRAAPGTVPLVCSYAEFLGLRAAGVPFVGWRSGLCDVAAAAPAPMAVLYPPEHEWCKDLMARFSFGAMGVAADCLEFVCRDADDVRRSKIVDHLRKRPADKIDGTNTSRVR